MVGHQHLQLQRAKVASPPRPPKKSSKKFEPALTPEEELAAAQQKEENRNAARIIYHNNDFPGIKDIRRRHNLPEAGTWDTDVSSELAFMDAEWQKKHPKSFFTTHIFNLDEVKEHLESMCWKAGHSGRCESKNSRRLFVHWLSNPSALLFPNLARRPGDGTSSCNV